MHHNARGDIITYLYFLLFIIIYKPLLCTMHKFFWWVQLLVRGNLNGYICRCFGHLPTNWINKHVEVGESIVSALTIQDGEPSLMRRLVGSWTLHVARCRTRGVWPTCVLERERRGVQWGCHSIIAKAKKNSSWPQNKGKKEKKNQRQVIQHEFESVGPSLLKTKQKSMWNKQWKW